MITIPIDGLAIAIMLVGLFTGMICFWVGFFLGRKKESEEIMEYYTGNQMSLTGELVRDRYPHISITKPIPSYGDRKED